MNNKKGSMNKIIIKNAKENNLKNISVELPFNKLIAVVGKSGSGKSSFVYNVLYRYSKGEKVKAEIFNLPERTFALSQTVKPSKNKSLNETNFSLLSKIIDNCIKGDLLLIDEPCAGMNKADRLKVINLLRLAIKKGSSVLVVDHHKDTILSSDYVVEFGPEAGYKGGYIVFSGAIDKYKDSKTPTSVYVFSNKAEEVNYIDSSKKKVLNYTLTIKNINKNNFKNYTLKIILGKLNCICGGIATGKSTLLSVVYSSLFKGKNSWKIRNNDVEVLGKENVRRSYFIDQSLLSKNYTSAPVTYLKVWNSIQKLYSLLPESKINKLTKSDFVFSKAMDVKVSKIKYNGYSIGDILSLTIDQVVEIFKDVPLVKRKFGFLQEVGLGYLSVGQKCGSLSGGEAQRVRLAKVLSKKLGDRCVYILDIPSKGLHLSDLPVLINIFRKIIANNNTVLIADNREELINNCDNVIQL